MIPAPLPIARLTFPLPQGLRPHFSCGQTVGWTTWRREYPLSLHEPYDALLANEQVIHPGFMVPMHSKKRKGALHEPTHPRPLRGGEQALVRALSVPLLGGVRGGFMVPMHSKKRKGALHEP